MKTFQDEVLRRLDELESKQLSRQPPIMPSRTPLTDRNAQNIQQPNSAMEEKIQVVLNKPKITAPVQLGLELTKAMFTDMELATCSLTGRRVNGQVRPPIDPTRLCLIDNLVQQKYSLGEAEFAAVRSIIQDSIANRSKYLRMKLLPTNINVF